MWLRLSKLFLSLLILYAGYFQAVFFQIPNMLLILGALAVLFLLIMMFQKSTPIRHGFTIETVLWIVFAASSLFIGYIVALDQHYLIVSIITLIENLILIIAICFVCKYDGNTDYVVNVFIVLALLCAITTMFWGESYLGGDRISLTTTTNPNGLGVLLVIGMFFLLYKLDINKMFSIVFVSAGTLVFLYTIIMTGSRKSFLAAILLLIYWFLFCFSGALKKINFSRRTSAIILFFAAVIFFIHYITPIFDNSVLLQRLTDLFDQGSATRSGMYSEAYRFFLSNPLFGVGYNNYRLLSIYGTYSHSTYAEALACTGLMGVFLYFGAYIAMVGKIITVVFDKRLNSDVHIHARIILGIFIIMLFLGTGIIHFYEINSSIVFAIVISFNKLYYKPNRRLVLR